jgi:hypothetical protein
MKKILSNLIEWIQYPYATRIIAMGKSEEASSRIDTKREKHNTLDLVIEKTKRRFRRRRFFNITLVGILSIAFVFYIFWFGYLLTIVPHFFPRWDNNSQATKIERVNELWRITSIISANFAIVGFFVTVTKYFIDSHFNRKKSGHDFLINIFLGRITELRQQLKESDVNPYSMESMSYTQCVAYSKIDPYGKHEILINSFLNHLEYMCLAIYEGLIDEKMAKDAEENILFIYWKWFYPYICEFRRKYYPEAWIFIDVMIKRWKPQEAEKVIRQTQECLKINQHNEE